MDPAMPTSPTDASDVKPSFKKPSNDAINRKYRRHSPDAASQSSSEQGSPKRQRSLSPPNSKQDRPVIRDGKRRKDVEKEREESSRHHSSRGYNSQKSSDRQSYGRFEDHRRRDDHSRFDRHAEDDERRYQRSSRSGRDSRNDSYSDYAKGDRLSNRSRDSRRTADKGEFNDSRSKHIEKDYEKSDTGSRQLRSDRDSSKFRDQDQHEEKEYRADRRDRNRSPGSKGNHASHEESRAHGRDVSRNRDGDSPLWRRSDRLGHMDITGNDHMQKREYDDLESDRIKEKSDSKQDLFQSRRTNFTDKPNSSVKLEDKADIQTMNSTVQKPEDGKHVDQAKVAALKAAELVNKNIVGFGGPSFLSTDQKKKLLWGNKKNTPAEETSSRWDSNLFLDRERQEKFNKLMGVKGNLPVEKQQEHKDVEAKKREELDMDLEKQYTAGLRRRDGRTVGLGL